MTSDFAGEAWVTASGEGTMVLAAALRAELNELYEQVEMDACYIAENQAEAGMSAHSLGYQSWEGVSEWNRENHSVLVGHGQDQARIKEIEALLASPPAPVAPVVFDPDYLYF